MTTAIEQAISHLIQTRQPITVSHVLPIYLQFAGLSSMADLDSMTAIITFERAMDKHPAPSYPIAKRDKTKMVTLAPLPCKRLYHAEVEQLRRDYWEKAIELGSTFGLCNCVGCGRLLDIPSREDLSSHLPAPEPKRLRKRKTRKRIIRPVLDVDPYGASTSARCL
ncbi:hypothetical protein EUX98_g8938 [Antrodiella citrinella]|uniref:Uncharacterized protein n=1 Tax=Antrodiella citrinella TaxID=2447956 RepID=A0A4S4M0J4_9APHY|nr:hypothetical protein EUX98_g8938 [Antrodiella citrinella]